MCLGFRRVLFRSLGGADLSQANLANTYLQGADLRGASIEGTDLQSLDIRGVKVDLAFAIAFTQAHGGIMLD